MKLVVRVTNSVAELLLLYLGVIVVSAVAYALLAHKALLDAMWWAFVTATTTGYGDMYPTTLGGRLVAVVLMHATLLFILPLLIGRVIGTMIDDRHKFTDEEQRRLMADIAEIKAALASRSHDGNPA